MPVKKSTLVLALVLITLITGVLGVIFYQHEKEVTLEDKGGDLKAIAELKAGQIEAWHKERIADARVISADRGFARLVKGLTQNPGEERARSEIADRLKLPLKEYGYRAIIIVSPEGKILYSTSEIENNLSRVTLLAVKKTVERSTIEVTDFYDNSVKYDLGYDVTAPLILDEKKPFAVLILLIDTDVLINPVLSWWPEESRSSETMMGTVSGDSVFYVKMMSREDNTPSGFYHSRKDSSALLTKASYGSRGVVSGSDYKGEEVIGYISGLRENSWFIITKTNKDEILSGMHNQAILLILITGVSLLCISAIGLYIYGRRQKNIYRELWQAEQEFRTTIYSIGDAVITTDIRGRVKHMNPVAEELTGWKENEAAGRPSEEVFNIVSETERGPVENPVQRVVSDGLTVGLANHTLLIAKDGSERPVADSGAPIRNAKGEISGVVLVFRDQTTERASRRALEISKERYSRALSLVDDAVWEWEVATGNVFASDNLYKMLGYIEKSKLRFDDWMALVQQDDRALLLQHLNETIHSSKNFSMDVRFRNNAGEYIWLEVRGAAAGTSQTGAVTQLAGTVININDRKEAEYKVILLNERLERAEQSAGLGSWEFNPEAARGFWSPMMFRLFDLEPALTPPMNEDYFALIHPDDRPLIRDTMSALMSGSFPEVHIYRTNPDRCRLRYLLPTWRFVANSEGRIIRFEGTLQDITELRFAEENYKKLFSQMTEGFALHKVVLGEQGNPVDFITVSMNPAYEKITGASPAQYLDKKIIEVIPGYSSDKIRLFCDVAITGNPVTIEEFDPNTRRYFTISVFRPYEDHFAVILNDSTEKKAAETIKKVQLLIAGNALASQTTAEMAERLREDLAAFIDTKNFLFAQYHEEQSRFSAVYYKDEYDIYTTWRSEGSLAGHVIKQNKICIYSQQEIMKLGGIGLIKLSGRIPLQWVGIPLRSGKTRFGVIIMQSHHDPTLYSQNQRPLLEVIARELSIYLDQIEHEQKIRESEYHFRQMFENHAAIKLFIHPETGAILDANVSATRFYGYSLEELKKMKIYDLSTSPADLLKNRMKMIMERKINRSEVKHRLRSGETRDVEIYSSPIQSGDKISLYAIIHDISERKKAEEQNKLLIQSIENSPVSVVITDPRGSIVYVNNNFTEVTGYSRDEALGDHPGIIESGLRIREVYQEMLGNILYGKSWRGELQSKRKNGELYWEDAIITPLVNEEGEVTHFVAVKEDVTEKRKMLEELIQAKESAEEMNKIKSIFFANMSHELRTPLIGILGFSEILQSELEGNPELIYMAETINKGGNRLLSTLNMILNLSKLEAGKLDVEKERTDIIQVIAETYSLFRPAAHTRGLEINFTPERPNIYCLLDKTLLGNVINNIINNALKFTEKGGITITARTENDIAVITIADTGIGISDNQKALVWEEFRQGSEGLSRGYEGTGLGLTIAKKYTEIMDGRISLESKKGEGTTFTIMFDLMKNEE